MSDITVALVAAVCTAILAYMSFLKESRRIRSIVAVVALVGIYCSVVQAYRTKLIYTATQQGIPQTATRQTERAVIKQAIASIIKRGADFLLSRQTFSHAVATASFSNTDFDSFLCEQIRSDAFIYRDRALNELRDADRFGGAYASYASKNCTASLPKILAELNTLAQRL